MLVEMALISGASLFYLKKDEMKIKRKWNQIMASGSWFTNALGKSIKILDIDKVEYGYDIKIEFPYSYTFDDFEKDLPIFKEGMNFQHIETENFGNICIMKCVSKKQFVDFKPYPLPPHKILIADGLNKPIIVDMNSFPHLLIGGDVGTGKSRVLFCILSNLIATTNQVEINLLQVRKNDLQVFENCKQVKTCSKTLEEVRDALKAADEECLRREPLINPTEGIYSIVNYNEKNPYKKLKYMYIVIEEFSFLTPNKGDSKEESAIKKQCMKYLRGIVNVGRAEGVFVMISIQKPTNDSIPSDIKAQLTTRVSLRIDDPQPAIVIMGNNSPTELQKRQLIVRTLDKRIGYSYTIDHEKIMDSIKPSIINKPKKDINPPKKIEFNIGKPKEKETEVFDLGGCLE